jgi:hypothetical protein
MPQDAVRGANSLPSQFRPLPQCKRPRDLVVTRAPDVGHGIGGRGRKGQRKERDQSNPGNSHVTFRKRSVTEASHFQDGL